MASLGLDDYASSSDDDDERLPSPGSSRPPKRPRPALAEAICVQCGAEGCRYRCPRCSEQFCSGPCMTKHKDVTGCSGKRDRTAFLAVKEMTDRSLRSDYQYLEEVSRAAEGARRSLSRFGTTTKARGNRLPRSVHQLMGACKLCEIHLLLQPSGMKRHDSNTSRATAAYRALRGTLVPGEEPAGDSPESVMSVKEGLVRWRVEWLFPHATALPLFLVDQQRSDVETLDAMLDERMQPRADNLPVRSRLEPYRDTRTVLLPQHGVASASSPVTFIELDSSRSLRENLRGRTVVEYPTLVVLARALTSSERGGVPSDAAASSKEAVASVRGADSSDSVPITHVLGEGLAHCVRTDWFPLQ
jgi:hypothetical protein